MRNGGILTVGTNVNYSGALSYQLLGDADRSDQWRRMFNLLHVCPGSQDTYLIAMDERRVDGLEQYAGEFGWEYRVIHATAGDAVTALKGTAWHTQDRNYPEHGWYFGFHEAGWQMEEIRYVSGYGAFENKATTSTAITETKIITNGGIVTWYPGTAGVHFFTAV